MGKIFDFFKNSKLEVWWETIPSTVINNYYVTVDNKIIQLTEEEFRKYNKTKSYSKSISIQSKNLIEEK